MNSKIYLPGLNGLRSIAASAVVFGHVLERLYLFHQEKNTFLDSFAGYSVTIFFTLSGFLITYLLLHEKQKTNTIDVKNFYLRRILRIWPLYYFYLIVAFIIGGYLYNKDIFYYIFIIPNFEFARNAAFGLLITYPLLGHYWSLGVEEQFYAFWPIFIKKIRNVKKFIFLFLLFFMVIKFGLTIFDGPIILRSIFNYTRFSCLAIGAIGATLFYNKNSIINLFKNTYIVLFLWGGLILFLFNIFNVYTIINSEIVSFITLGIILSQLVSEKPVINLENNVMDFLGKISFGIYIYNPIAIYLFSLLFNYYEIKVNVLFLCVLVYVLTISISFVSYNYFEKPFLKFKQRFTIIKSSPSRAQSESE